MKNWDQFNDEVVPYLQRIEAIPFDFQYAEKKNFLSDLYNICSKNNTQWHQEQFMFDKYSTENLDFNFVITATNSALSNINHDLSDKEILSKLISIGEEFLIKAAPNMPLDLARATSSFVVNKSAFYSDFGLVRASLDTCAAEWEEYPLPKFEWPWPELEKELAFHKKGLPEHLQPQNSTTFGDRDLARWHDEILNEADEYWLKSYLIKDLRKLQKEFNLRPSRTKQGLIKAIIELYPVPTNIRMMIDKMRNSVLYRIEEEKINREAPLSERYKRHLVRLVQTRVDSYFIAHYSLRSPSGFLNIEHSRKTMFCTIKERTLVIRETCCFCENKKKIIHSNNSDDLPPFHLLCSCELPWWETNFDTLFSNKSASSPLLEKEIHEFVEKNTYSSGLGIKLPTEQYIERFINASIKDKENSKTLFNRLVSKIIHILS